MRREPLWLLLIGAAVFAWSGWKPFDRATWVLEVFPVILAVPLLWATRRRFPLTPLAYRLILVHAIILMIGGKYTYEHVPAGYAVQAALGLARNPYDRLGHLAQGFIPAVLVREVLRRCSPLSRGGWLFFLTTCVCLAISASYELVEWAVAVCIGQASDAFLGTQGDPWDTQWDMFCALIGALVAQLALARLHDRQLKSLS